MQKYIDFHTCPPVPLGVAPRGARGHAPENTLTAAALGYAVQAERVTRADPRHVGL